MTSDPDQFRAFRSELLQELGALPIQHLSLDRLESREATMFAEAVHAQGFRGVLVTEDNRLCRFIVWEALGLGEQSFGWSLMTGSESGLRDRFSKRQLRGRFLIDLRKILDLPPE